MLRTIATVSLAGVLGLAPFQCGKGRDPGLSQEETAGDALWALAQSFADAGDDPAARKTYRFLVERYPSSRYAPAAKDELERANSR